MRLSAFAATTAVVAALSVLAAPADAATSKKKRVVAVSGTGHTVYVSRGEDGRTRTRILVQRRSYLDGGTEVLPGERKFTDYAMPPNHSPTSVIDNTTFARQSPFPGPFDLPGGSGFGRW